MEKCIVITSYRLEFYVTVFIKHLLREEQWAKLLGYNDEENKQELRSLVEYRTRGIWTNKRADILQCQNTMITKEQHSY